MNKETIRKFNWFWAWQDEKEEAWLSEMAREGLHLISVSPFGFYQFQKGAPENYVYQLDFQTLKSKDRDSYLQLFEDAGWEHIGDMGGWAYFRHKVAGEKIPEIYSDLGSKMGKYQRLIMFLIIFLPIMIILMPRSVPTDYFGPVLATILEMGQALLMIIYAYSMFMLIRRIGQLKNKSKG